MPVETDLYSIPCFAHLAAKTVDEWAEDNIILRDSGRLRYAETPWMREPTRAAGEVYTTCRVVISTPAQSAKTTAIIAVLCHQAVYHPANTMLLLDTEHSARRLVKNRLKPALRDFAKVPSLQKGQTSGVLDVSSENFNIALASGANLIAGSAKSVSALASTPIQLLCLDEVDRYARELDGEGDPVTLAIKRTLRYRHSMTLMTSTPTIPDGRITQYYGLGTCEVWSVKCSACGAWMPVHFDDIDFTGSTPVYACPFCGQVYAERDVIELEHGYAPPENKTPYRDKNGRIARSFKVTAPLVHSAYTWDSIETERRQAEAIGLPAIRSWRNVTVGEPYEPPSIAITDFTGLLSRRLMYDRESLPEWVAFTVAGVDTQDNRFEMVVAGYSVDTLKCAVIEHRVFFGDVINDSTVWEALKAYIGQTVFKTVDGRSLPIGLTMIDAGGHATMSVYALALQSPYVRPVRGRSYRMAEEERQIIDRVQRRALNSVGNGAGRIALTWVNTRYCKDLLYYRLGEVLQNRDCGLYFSSVPDLNQNENFFEQLTSEEKYETKNGISLYRVKAARRNEALDCMVYAMAGAESVRLSLCQLPSVTTKRGIEDEKPHETPKKDIQIEQKALQNVENASIIKSDSSTSMPVQAQAQPTELPRAHRKRLKPL